MQQYLVTAYDFYDASDRRLASRAQHLALLKELKSSGNFLTGGAILNKEGTMTGSLLIVQFETYEELNQWLKREPYMNNKVWDKVEIKTFRVANIE